MRHIPNLGRFAVNYGYLIRAAEDPWAFSAVVARMLCNVSLLLHKVKGSNPLTSIAFTRVSNVLILVEDWKVDVKYLAAGVSSDH